MTTVRLRAPAKVNLTLHVTGKRNDGYHTLDTLVMFADFGDELAIKANVGASLVVGGPEAEGVPTDAANLILKAAGLFRQGATSSFRLTKYIPKEAGLGGGSADAAAALRGLSALYAGFPERCTFREGAQREMTELERQILALGADVPMCLLSRTLRARGIGEAIDPLDHIPPVHAVLVNPRVAVSTPSIFRSLTHRTNPAMPEKIPEFADVHSFAEWLAYQRNDLEAPAINTAPIIADALDLIREHPSCLLARMSGSGATCFGIFQSAAAASAAAEQVRAAQPDWWIKPVMLGVPEAVSRPRFS